MEILHSPQGNFELSRYPIRPNEQLRAWDAADEYLLNYIFEENRIQASKKILIVNDNFGALSVALQPTQYKYSVTVWTDSYLSQEGIRQNLVGNNFNEDDIEIIHSTDSLTGCYDLVLVKIPKSHALLEDQLYRLRKHLNENSTVIAAAMAKNIHSSTLELFEKYIGETKTSLAKKKARLVFSRLDKNIDVGVNPYPVRYQLENSNFTISNHANIFSREKLDIGTRFFIEHLPVSGDYKNIIDLGCGNGVLGLLMAKAYPDAMITFTDESYMAIASAKENMQSNLPGHNNSVYAVTDCLDGIKQISADIILNNPPFHQQHAIGDEVAWKMFKQAKNILTTGGELWVIGNRHLAYHIKIKKIFGNCRTVASNKKFVILKAMKNI